MRSNSYGRLAGKEEAEAIISLAQQFDKNLNGKSFLICFVQRHFVFSKCHFLLATSVISRASTNTIAESNLMRCMPERLQAILNPKTSAIASRLSLR